jgi:hypothetical protein
MRRQRGYTLMETLIAGAMTVTLGCALWLGWSAAYSSWNVVQDQNTAYANGRQGIDRMVDELRGATAITAATASSVTITNAAGQSVRYALANGNLVRTVGGSTTPVALGITNLSLSYVLSTGGTSSAPSQLSQVKGAVLTLAANGGEGARNFVTAVRMRNL